MQKTRVAVLRGGISDEYSVSLKTGASILEHMDTTHFDPLDVVVSKSGEWLIDGRVRLPEQILHCIDIVFIALHGKYGEDGTVQRLLDKFGVTYTGSRAFPSAIAMNKILTKDYIKDLSIRLPQHFKVTSDSLNSLDRIAEHISNLFGPEYMIKPVTSGSSFGTMMVKSPLLLRNALFDALQVYDEVMVEEYIRGKEATCGVVERFRGENIYVLPVVEIVTPEYADFYDTNVKYNGSTQKICPSRFSSSTKWELEEAARRVHETLGLSQYSRSDFIVRGDEIFFLEVNTLPGLTTDSIFPRALDAVGTPYAAFITHLLTDALENSRSYATL